MLYPYEKKFNVVVNINIRDVIVYTCIASFPYFFLTLGDVNVSLFDVLLLTLLPIVSFHRKKVKIVSGTFYALSTCVIVLSILPLLSYAESLEYVWGTLQMMYILLVMYPLITSVISEKRYRISLKAACIVWSFFLLFNVGVVNDLKYYEAAGRFTSLYNSPLSLGLTTAVIIPLLLSFTNSTKSLLLKLLFSLSVLLGIFYIYISGSRASALGLALGLVFYLLTTKRYGVLSATFCISTLVLTYGYSYVSPDISQVRDLSNRLFVDTSLREINRVLFSPNTDASLLLFGAGIGNGSLYNVTRPHNFFISMAEELGISGMLIFAWIMYLSLGKGIILTLFKGFRFDKNRNLKLATLSSGIVFFVALLVSAVPLHRGYWFILALCFWTINTKKHKA